MAAWLTGRSRRPYTSALPPASAGVVRLSSETASRVLLRRMFDAALAACDPARCVPPHLPRPPAGRTVVVGAGKAAAAMAAAVEAHWQGKLGQGKLDGLVVTRYGHGASTRHIEVVEASHPVPDAAGADAAARILGAVG